MAKRRVLNKQPQTATIDALAHDGRGIAHINGKAVFIDAVLPEEQVVFQYTVQRRHFDEGRVIDILRSSPQRQTPRCAHFARCGGCSLQHLDDRAQLDFKENMLQQNLRRLGKVQAEIWAPSLQAESWGYRGKARLGVKYVAGKQKVLVGFREKHSAFLAEMQSCEVLQPQVGRRLDALASLIARLQIYAHIAQIEVAAGNTNCALVFRVLSEPLADDRAQLEKFGYEYGFDIWLQPGGPDSLQRLYVHHDGILHYHLPERVIIQFQPLDFTQVNRALNYAMVEQVLQWLAPQLDEQILDLFCGLGNFSLPLARRAAHVVGVEGELGLVKRARENAVLNDIHNIEFHSSDLFNPNASRDWLNSGYVKVLIDPPRSGAKEIIPIVVAMRPRAILYVSCNPATLARDAGTLVHEYGYRLSRAGVMDMFPQTSHIECMALFEC